MLHLPGWTEFGSGKPPHRRTLSGFRRFQPIHGERGGAERRKGRRGGRGGRPGDCDCDCASWGNYLRDGVTRPKFGPRCLVVHVVQSCVSFTGDMERRTYGQVIDRWREPISPGGTEGCRAGGRRREGRGGAEPAGRTAPAPVQAAGRRGGRGAGGRAAGRPAGRPEHSRQASLRGRTPLSGCARGRASRQARVRDARGAMIHRENIRSYTPTPTPPPTHDLVNTPDLLTTPSNNEKIGKREKKKKREQKKKQGSRREHLRPRKTWHTSRGRPLTSGASR